MLNHSPRQRQRGVVMILALFIVVLVTTVVVSVSWRFNLSMARNENRWHGAQARAYLEGGEELAQKILMQDAKETQHDWLGEFWAQPGDPLPTDEGWVQGKLEDAHGRFNINLLTGPAPTGTDDNDGSPYAQQQFSTMQEHFIRLLQLLELEQSGPIDQQKAMAITQAIEDWLDYDHRPTGMGGAERSYYNSLDPRYPIANGPFTSVSELLVIKGMTPEIYEKLLPYVIALPVGSQQAAGGGQQPNNNRAGGNQNQPRAIQEYEKMNVNTLKPLLLRTFNQAEVLQPLDEANWKFLVEAREAQPEGFQDVQAFNQAVEQILGTNYNQRRNAGNNNGQNNNANNAPSLFTVKSHFFLYFGETAVGNQVRRSKSLLFRSGPQKVEVIRRTDANF